MRSTNAESRASKADKIINNLNLWYEQQERQRSISPIEKLEEASLEFTPWLDLQTLQKYDEEPKK